jgi:hypothetical protein
MHATADNTTTSQSRPASNPTHPPASKLVSTWTEGRRRYTPWAYPRLRAFAVTRLAVAVFLVGLTAVFFGYGHDGWAVIPLVGAAVVGAIGSLDMSAARLVSRRS